MRFLALVLFCLSLYAADADPSPKLDRVTLTTGGVLVGTVTEEGDGYAVQVGAGTMHLKRDAVKAVEKGVADVAVAKVGARPGENAKHIDYDAVAAQRYQDAHDKQKAGDAERRAISERNVKEKSDLEKASIGERWIMPKGKEAKTIPAWAQGEWGNGSDPIVIGPTKIYWDQQSPPFAVSITSGGDWVRLIFNSPQGAIAGGSLGYVNLAIRKIDDHIEYGGVDRDEKSQELYVDKWITLTARK